MPIAAQPVLGALVKYFSSTHFFPFFSVSVPRSVKTSVCTRSPVLAAVQQVWIVFLANIVCYLPLVIRRLRNESVFFPRTKQNCAERLACLTPLVMRLPCFWASCLTTTTPEGYHPLLSDSKPLPLVGKRNTVVYREIFLGCIS